MGNATRQHVPKPDSGPRGGNLGLLLAALGMGAVMGKQVIEDLGELAVRARRVGPEAVLLRAAEGEGEAEGAADGSG